MPGKAQERRQTNNHGYIRVWKGYYSHARADVQGYVCEHILVAEKALGKSLPHDAEVHHIDENRANNLNVNLVICENHAYHGLLHHRMHILYAGGNPNLHKICSSCKELKYQFQFGNRSRNPDGLREECKDCVS